MDNKAGKVAVIYHFFPHYRAAIMNALLQSEQQHYILVGEDFDITNSGIKSWVPEDRERFVHTTGRFIKNRYFFQSGVITLSFRKDIHTFIYLGDVQFITTWIAATLARVQKKRVLFWTHGWNQKENGFKGWLRRTFYRLADGLLLYGKRAKEIAITQGFDPKDIYVVYNSLDYDLLRKYRDKVTYSEIILTRRQLFQDPDLPMIMCTGRLIKKRGVDMLLKAMHLLKLSDHRVNLLVVGDGPERDNLTEMALDWDLPVIFFGACYDEDVLSKFFVSANVTVSPGMVGLTAMHSLSYGTPVITHDCLDMQMPEVEAIIPGVNGDFFKKDDVEHLSQMIEKWTLYKFLTPETRKVCYESIEWHYTPWFQRNVIEQAVMGKAAWDE